MGHGCKERSRTALINSILPAAVLGSNLRQNPGSNALRPNATVRIRWASSAARQLTIRYLRWVTAGESTTLVISSPNLVCAEVVEQADTVAQ